MEEYRTEEEQVEALRRWWNENGRSLVIGIVIALAAGFGWQAWQAHDIRQEEQASDLYQALLRAVEAGQDVSPGSQAVELAEQLKSEFSRSNYAQFAALHLAALAVGAGNLPDAEAQLRWVLGKAAVNSDTAQIAQLRLARVVAASGDSDQALQILTKTGPGPYAASYAVAQGDILLAAARRDEAREAYLQAITLAGGPGEGVNLSVLQQKLQSLTPVPPTPQAQAAAENAAGAAAVPNAVDTTPPTDDTIDVPEE